MKNTERVIQFGEGVFLRAFVDYFLQELNDRKLWEGKVVVVQPRENGKCYKLMERNCKYHLFMRGIREGQKVSERKDIDVISRCVDPYKNFEDYLKLAENPDIKFVVSNTTEAGITYTGTESFDDCPAAGFPAKLTQLLYHRYKSGLSGWVFIPCELIDNNAKYLKECILKYALKWELEDAFTEWIDKENSFCNSLVDRIVTGFPEGEAEDLFSEIGETDKCLDTSEIFHLWVIEGNYEKELPFNKAGLNVIWTNDVSPYKKRKVRILNGGHTSMVFAALLSGCKTVGECILDDTIKGFLKSCIYDEILPVLSGNLDDSDMNQDENRAFADAVIERFKNPYIEHRLEAIAMNSISKFRVRVLKTLLEFREKFGEYPKCLTMSLAALITYYKEKEPDDDPDLISFIKNNSTEDILANTGLWECDLSELNNEISGYESLIKEKGMRKALESLL